MNFCKIVFWLNFQLSFNLVEFQVPVWWCSSQLRTAGSSAHQVLLLIRHAQIFSDNFPNFVLFYVQLIYDHSNSQTMFATHNLSYLPNINLSPACWRPPAPRIIFHLLAPFFESLKPLKNSDAQHAKVFHILVMEFSPTRPKISGLFIPHCS